MGNTLKYNYYKKYKDNIFKKFLRVFKYLCK